MTMLQIDRHYPSLCIYISYVNSTNLAELFALRFGVIILPLQSRMTKKLRLNRLMPGTCIFIPAYTHAVVTIVSTCTAYLW